MFILPSLNEEHKIEQSSKLEAFIWNTF